MIVEMSKGYQITVPAKIREKYGLQPGSKFELEDEDGELVLHFHSEDWESYWKDVDRHAVAHDLTPEDLDDFSDVL